MPKERSSGTTKEEKNEVAVKEAAPAVSIMNGLEAFAQFRTEGPVIGLEEVSQEDIKMPKVRLIQPTSQEATDEKAKPGQYINMTTGDIMDDVTCHLLSVKKGRVMWPEKFSRGDQPECRSFDGEISVDGEVCATCPNRVWKDGKRPACGQVYSWMGVLGDDTPFRVNFAGAGISKNKDLLTQLKLTNLPAFVFNMKLTSEKMKNDKGTYYITNFELEKDATGKFVPVTMEQYEKYKEMTKALSEIFSRAQVQDLSTYEGDEVGEEDDIDPTTGKKKLF